MDSAQLLAVMDLLAAEGIAGWVDGGWGVDALLGEQGREHADLDLVVDVQALGRLLALLTSDGFAMLRDDLPVAVALRHDDGREVDLHPVELTGDGGGDQRQPDGTSWHYGPPTTGRIAGRPVPCCGLDTQLRSHLGYPPDENDVADMRALANRFGCPLPAAYQDL